MSHPKHEAMSSFPDHAEPIPTRPISLRDVIKDGGGTTKVAARLGVSAPSVYGWMSQGHLPLSDLQGKTTYSEKLAGMQKTLALSAADIRRLGLRL